MVIERLHLQDYDTAEELWSLQQAAYRMELAAIGEAVELPPLKDTVASLQRSAETFWGCRSEDGELIGAVAAEEEGGVVTVCRMMVHPEFFRQGIGSRLLDCVLNAYPEARRFEVTAEKRNAPAIALYGKLGFSPVGTVEPLPGITLVRMAKDVRTQP
ncbi:GNAT family N-acetyltransferase [Cohnella laeviribosi]|mgnify:CR=1 FL=1|uniref:GNAT family N-acetyltransferase n=1 Tax=Cohnella laeviribosi TaxID=380174 RepID=UPI000375B8B2|nr:GNAT family N-acetyltransferase [Cohnella laeviribosi]